MPEDVSVTKWIHEMDFNPMEYFDKITIPILLFYGETDRWVPPLESIAVWKKALKNANNDQFEIQSVKDAGHMMILNEDNDPEEEIISDSYAKYLTNWITKRVK